MSEDKKINEKKTKSKTKAEKEATKVEIVEEEKDDNVETEEVVETEVQVENETTEVNEEIENEPVVETVVDETVIKESNNKVKKEKKEKIKKEKVPFKVWVAEHKATVIITSIVVGLLLILGILLTVFFLTDGSKTAIKYNGGSVSKVIYETYYKLFSPILQYYYGYPDEASIKAEIANKAVLDRLILADIEKKGLNITLTEDDKQSIEEQLSDKDRLESYKSQGININVLRQLFYEDVKITKYLELMKANITDEQAKSYASTSSTIENNDDLNKYITRHILFKVDSTASEEDRKAIEDKANGVLDRIKNGEKLADLTAEFSEDTATKSNNGLYEMFMDGETIDAYATAVKMLTVGSVTQNLVKADYGYHIIYLENIVPDGRLPRVKEDMVNNDLEKMQKDANIQPVAKVIAEVE